MEIERKYKKVFSIFLLLILLVASLHPVLAATNQPTSDQGTVKQVIRVGYNDYYGFIEENADGTYYGYAVDYLNTLAQYGNFQFEYVQDTFASLMSRAISGDIDILCQTQKTAEREKTYLFSDYEVGTEITALYVAESQRENFYYDDPESLDGMCIAMLESSAQNDVFAAYAAENDFSYTAKYYGTVEECFNALYAGEADGIIMGSLAGQNMQNICLAGRLGSDPYYIMSAKKNTALMTAINEAQAKMYLEQPYLQASLFDKYYANTAAFSDVLYTREEGIYLQSHDELTLAMRTDALPMSRYTDEDGAYGILYDLTESLAGGASYAFNYTKYQSGQTPGDYLKANPENALISVYSGNEQQQGLIASDTIYSSSAALIGRKDADAALQVNQSLAVYAIPKGGSALADYIMNHSPDAKLIYCETAEECLKMVQTKKADYAVYSLQIMSRLMSDPHYSQLIILNSGFMQEDYQIMMLDTRDNRLMIQIINKSIQVMDSAVAVQSEAIHTTADARKMTFGDVLYQYRLPFTGFLLLLSFIIVLLIRLTVVKHMNMLNLQKKNEELKKANAARSEFMARMSHDMRTPMNGILGLTALMRTQSDVASIYKDLDQLEMSGKYLLELINDTLDVSVIENGKMTLHTDAVDSQRLIDNIVNHARIMAFAKGVKLEVSIPERADGAWQTIRVDASRVEQIFLNLISNAVKFTPEGGSVSLRMATISETADEITDRIVVEDTGVGISPDFLPHIFEAYSQEHSKQDDIREGSGLGLSIVKSLVELMQGEIQVESELGKGTRFTVLMHFPIVKATKKANRTALVSDMDMQGKHILLCEDHPLNAEIVCRMLQQKGMIVTVAENGKIGLHVFMASEKGYFDAILMDIRMPVMDGLQTAEAIRKSSHADAMTIPIIALSANAFPEDVEKSLAAGMNSHLAKPIKPVELIQTLKKFVK